MRLSLATWNVHGFVGSDARRDAERVIAVLRALDADVVALQEVEAGPASEPDVFETLGPTLGFSAVAGPTLMRGEGRYGNLLLSRYPLERIRRLDLSQPGQEPRGAIDVRISVGGARVRLLTTHLGLGRRERARQAQQLCDALDAEEEGSDATDDDLRVLLGDLNEWRRPLTSTGLAPVVSRFSQRSHLRTFPARVPLLALDRVLVDRPEAQLHLEVRSDAAVRAASDHLALCARVEI